MIYIKRNILSGLFTFFLSLQIANSSEHLVGSDIYRKALNLQNHGQVQIIGERRGFIKNQGALIQKLNLKGDQEYLAVVVPDKESSQLNLSIQDKKGNELAKSLNKTQLIALKLNVESTNSYIFELETEGKGGYYHFFLISSSKPKVAKES